MTEKRPQPELHIRCRSKTLWGLLASRQLPKVSDDYCTVRGCRKPDRAISDSDPSLERNQAAQ
jgi:hypothetical protein